ncbi:hypothetical protein llap_21037 [Limosa lapponica baueri]|uniref:Uncharacterized protein n=1 Tax=Limosa lapponica baueri TaxID=1758121 RepID=A0A2I0T4E1_LIMLA|nr:hypothetical protein llap_21037 [Limosa lapponica baueri]
MYWGAGLTKKIRVSPVETWLSQIKGSPKPPMTTLFPPSKRISQVQTPSSSPTSSTSSSFGSSPRGRRSLRGDKEEPDER